MLYNPCGYFKTTVSYVLSTNYLLSARSYPRHACPLYGVVFMQVHYISKGPPKLAGLRQNDPQTIMRSHAA